MGVYAVCMHVYLRMTALIRCTCFGWDVTPVSPTELPSNHPHSLREEDELEVFMLALPLTGCDTSIPQTTRLLQVRKWHPQGLAWGHPLSWGGRRRGKGGRGPGRNGVEPTLRSLRCSDKFHLPSQPDPQGCCKNTAFAAEHFFCETEMGSQSTALPPGSLPTCVEEEPRSQRPGSQRALQAQAPMVPSLKSTGPRPQ